MKNAEPTIVAIVMVASVLKARNRRRWHADGDDPAGPAENAALREEVRQLKERIAVLERITVEKENSLARDIEQLRDR